MTDATLHTFWEDKRDNYPLTNASVPSKSLFYLLGIWEALQGLSPTGPSTALTQAQLVDALDNQSTNITATVARLTEIRNLLQNQQEFNSLFVYDSVNDVYYERRQTLNEDDQTTTTAYYLLSDPTTPATLPGTAVLEPGSGTSTGNTVQVDWFEGTGANATYPDGNLFVRIQLIDSDGIPTGVAVWRDFSGNAVVAPTETEVREPTESQDLILTAILSSLGGDDTVISNPIPTDVTADTASLNGLLRRLIQLNETSTPATITEIWYGTGTGAYAQGQILLQVSLTDAAGVPQPPVWYDALTNTAVAAPTAGEVETAQAYNNVGFVQTSGTVGAVGDAVELDCSRLNGASSHNIQIIATGFVASETVSLAIEGWNGFDWIPIGASWNFNIIDNTSATSPDVIPLGSSAHSRKRVRVTDWSTAAGAVTIRIQASSGAGAIAV